MKAKEKEDLEEVLVKAVENIIVKKYRINIGNVSRRFNEINEIVHKMDKNIVVLNERTKGLNERIGDIRNLLYVVVGATLTTLASMVLMLIRLLT